MKILLRPFALLYKTLAQLRNWLFEKGFFAIYRAPIPVISIGNLTVGGTGKTPITDLCLKSPALRNKKVAVISRSYGGQVTEPIRVDLAHPFGARYYGDEAFLLAQMNPQVSVFVGKSKWKIAKHIVSNREAFDVFIVDDGFQHRRLHRDLDIVLLDCTELWANYRLVPEGRARESWSGLQRAQAVFLTKANLGSEETDLFVQRQLPQGKKVLKFTFSIGKFISQNSLMDNNPGNKLLSASASASSSSSASASVSVSVSVSPSPSPTYSQTQGTLSSENVKIKNRDEFLGKSFLLVSAIARPQIFAGMMSEIGPVSSESLYFRDHHQYSSSDLLKISEAFKCSKCDYLVTTEKDAVKLRALIANTTEFPTLWSALLEVGDLEQRNQLDELLHQVLG